jgi:hypothetical protein
MTNKVEDDLPDDDGERGGENDTDNYSPHALCSVIVGIKLSQHWHSLLAAASAI